MTCDSRCYGAELVFLFFSHIVFGVVALLDFSDG